MWALDIYNEIFLNSSIQYTQTYTVYTHTTLITMSLTSFLLHTGVCCQDIIFTDNDLIQI